MLAAALLLTLRAHTYDEPLERDITTYAVVGHELLAGRALYADLWDHKPPLIHALFAGAEALAGYGPRAVFLLNALGGLAALAGIASAVHRATGMWWLSAWAATAWALAGGDLGLQANQPNTELFMSALVAWTWAVAVRPGPASAAVVGAMGLAASLLKPVFLIPIAPLFIGSMAGLPRATRTRRAVLSAAIVPLGWIFLSLWFVARGSFPAFYDAVFSFNRAYAGSQAQNFFEAMEPPRLVPGQVRFLLPLGVAALAGAILGWRARRRSWALFAAVCVAIEFAILRPESSILTTTSSGSCRLSSARRSPSTRLPSSSE